MKKQGQIMRGTVFGEMIYEIAKSSSYIVDIGTWFGMGTTKCIIDGINK